MIIPTALQCLLRKCVSLTIAHGTHSIMFAKHLFVMIKAKSTVNLLEEINWEHIKYANSILQIILVMMQ